MTDDEPIAPGRRSRSDRAREVAQLLRTIQQEAEEKEFVRLEPGPPPRSPVWYLVLVLGVVLNLWVWIEQPAWLVGSSPAPRSEVEEERALRFQMFVQGQQIEAHRMDTGDLPRSLAEAGGPLPGMRYQRSGERSWELLGQSGQLRLILRGSQPMAEFVGTYEPLLGLSEPAEP